MPHWNRSSYCLTAGTSGQQLLNVSTCLRGVSTWTIPYGPPWSANLPLYVWWRANIKCLEPAHKLGCWPQGWQHHCQDHLNQHWICQKLHKPGLLQLGWLTRRKCIEIRNLQSCSLNLNQPKYQHVPTKRLRYTNMYAVCVYTICMYYLYVMCTHI